MIVCECTGTTDGTIRALARDGVTKVSEVTRRCGAGGCCQSCRPAIARILRATAATIAKEEVTVAEGLAPEARSAAL
jgi:bacterioferritin-associated ferredoxin